MPKSLDTGSLALLSDPRVRGAVVDYYSSREDIALQVERSLRAVMGRWRSMRVG